MRYLHYVAVRLQRSVWARIRLATYSRITLLDMAKEGCC